MTRRRLFLSLILILLAGTGAGGASAATKASTKDAYWHLTRNADPKTGAFDYCATESTFDNGLSLAFARNGQFYTNIVVGFSEPKLEKETKYPLRLIVDQNAPLPVTGFSADPKALVIPLKSNREFIDELAKGKILEMKGPRDSVKFSLLGAGEALNKLQDCVERSLAEQNGGQGGKTAATEKGMAAVTPPPASPLVLPDTTSALNESEVQPLPLPAQEVLPPAVPQPAISQPEPARAAAVAAPMPLQAPAVAVAPVTVAEGEPQDLTTLPPAPQPQAPAAPSPQPPAQVAVAPPPPPPTPSPLPAAAVTERPPVEAAPLLQAPQAQANSPPAFAPYQPHPPLPDTTEALNHMEAVTAPPQSTISPPAPVFEPAPVPAAQALPAPMPKSTRAPVTAPTQAEPAPPALPSAPRPEEQISSSTASTVVIVPANNPTTVIEPSPAPQSVSPPSDFATSSQPVPPAPQPRMAAPPLPAAEPVPAAPQPVLSPIAPGTLPPLPPLGTGGQAFAEPPVVPDISLAGLLAAAGIKAQARPASRGTPASYVWSQNGITGSGMEVPASGALDEFALDDIDHRAAQCKGKFYPSVGAAATSEAGVMISESTASCVRGTLASNQTLLYYESGGRMGVIALETPVENEAIAVAMRERLARAMETNTIYK